MNEIPWQKPLRPIPTKLLAYPIQKIGKIAPHHCRYQPYSSPPSIIEAQFIIEALYSSNTNTTVLQCLETPRTLARRLLVARYYQIPPNLVIAMSPSTTNRVMLLQRLQQRIRPGRRRSKRRRRPGRRRSKRRRRPGRKRSKRRRK